MDAKITSPFMKDKLIFMKGETIMKLFNKGEIYSIVVDEETNFWVQRFADNRSVKGGTVGVWKADNLTVVSFRTKETRAKISEELKNTFKGVYTVKIGEYLAFVTRKGGVR